MVGVAKMANDPNMLWTVVINDLLCREGFIFSCPAIISQRLESRIISKEPQENTEEESKII
jgi:hypothetical protein